MLRRDRKLYQLFDYAQPAERIRDTEQHGNVKKNDDDAGNP
jgi:hypothetical protein